MAHNYLEQLVAEWYEFRGYYVRRNVLVAKRPRGGHDAELDVIAFKPDPKHLVHVGASMDADSWEVRERRFTKKFAYGKEHIPSLFSGLIIPSEVEQIALFGFASTKTYKAIGGGKVMLIPELLTEIFTHLRPLRLAASAVPEQFALLRTLQLVSEYRKPLATALSG